jgi:alpha-beta hydrolase superfamily lysophospholipase
VSDQAPCRPAAEAGDNDSVTTRYPRWGTETEIPRGADQAPLTVRILRPEPGARKAAIVLLVHGMNEYIGRYREIAGHFARHFVVAGFDLGGHGLSNPWLAAADRAIAGGASRCEVGDAFLAQRCRSDLGGMRKDLELALRQVLALTDDSGNGHLPVFIVSHSLGSLVAASYLLDALGDTTVAKRLQGIVLLGPAFAVSQVPSRLGWLANRLIRWSFAAEEWRADRAAVHPAKGLLAGLWALPSSLLLNGLFELLSWPVLRRVFTPGIPGWVEHYLTDSEDQRARHRSDGYIIRRSLLRYVKGIEREIARFRRHSDGFDLPYFLVYSAGDPITPASGMHHFVSKTFDRHPDNAVLDLPHCYHHEHLFSAPPLDREILGHIEDWIDRRLHDAGAR